MDEEEVCPVCEWRDKATAIIEMQVRLQKLMALHHAEAALEAYRDGREKDAANLCVAAMEETIRIPLAGRIYPRPVDAADVEALISKIKAVETIGS